MSSILLTQSNIKAFLCLCLVPLVVAHPLWHRTKLRRQNLYILSCFQKQGLSTAHLSYHIKNAKLLSFLNLALISDAVFDCQISEINNWPKSKYLLLCKLYGSSLQGFCLNPSILNIVCNLWSPRQSGVSYICYKGILVIITFADWPYWD